MECRVLLRLFLDCVPETTVCEYMPPGPVRSIEGCVAIDSLNQVRDEMTDP